MTTTPTTEQKVASALRMKQEIIGLMLQHLEENGLRRSMHILESEACYYFDMQYAKQLWQEGRWEELLEYIEPFLNQANPVDEKKVKYLRWIIHRQRYWELVEAHKWTEAASLLANQLKEINTFVPDNNYYSELQNLLLQRLSKDEERTDHSKKFADPNVRLENWNAVAEKLLQSIPAIADKTKKPHIPQPSRLRTIINQSLNWQHSRCDPKDPNPQMLDNSLFVDHRCRVSNVAQKTSDSTPTRNVLEKSASTPTIPSQTQSPPAQVQAQSQPQQQQNLRKRPYNETNNVSETERDNSDLLQALKVKRPRSDDLSTEPPPLPTHLFTTIFFHEVRTLVMRFHPTNTSLLLIGIDAPSSRGAIVLYDVHQNKKLASIPSPSVKQLLWLPGGKEFVVIYQNNETIDIYTVVSNRESAIMTKSRCFRHSKNVFLLAACETTFPNEGRKVLLVSVSEGDKANEYEVFVWDVQSNNPSEPRFRCEWKNTENYAKPSAVAIATQTIEKQIFTFVTLVVGKQCYVYVLNNNPVKHVPIFTEFSLPNTTRCLDVAVVKGSFIVCASDMMTKHDLVNGRLEITYENFTEPNYKPTVGNIDIYDNRIVVPISNKLKFWQLDSPKLLSSTPFDRPIGMVSFNANGEMIAVATNTNILMLLTLPSIASNYKGPLAVHFSNQLEIIQGAEILPLQPSSSEKTATGTPSSISAAILQALAPSIQKSSPQGSNVQSTETSPSVKNHKPLDTRTNGLPSSSSFSPTSTATTPTPTPTQTSTSPHQHILSTKQIVQVKEHYTFTQSHPGKIIQLYWARNGTLAISLSNDGELRTWSSSTPLTPQPLSNVSVHFEKYSYKCQEPQTNPLFAITNTEAYVLVSPGNGELILLSKQGNQLSEKTKLYDSSKDQFIISALALHPDNQNLLIFGSLEGALHSFIQNSKDKKRLTRYSEAVSHHQSKITSLLFVKNVSNKPPILIAVSLNGRVTAWSAELEQENEKSPIRNFNLTFLRSISINSSSDTEPDITTCARVSPIKPNQNVTVVMSQRKVVTKVDPTLESPTRYIHNHSSNITTCCFASNGTHILCGLDTGAILILDEKMNPFKILELQLPSETHPTTFAQSNAAPNQILFGTNKGTLHSVTIDL